MHTLFGITGPSYAIGIGCIVVLVVAWFTVLACVVLAVYAVDDFIERRRSQNNQ